VTNKRLLLIIVAGLAIRVALAFIFDATRSHMQIEEASGRAVRDWDWHAAYETGLLSWSYPPLFLSWLALASWLSDVSGLAFHGFAKLGPSLADVGLALAIYVYLGWRLAPETARLAGAALVMLGPSFIAVSGYHGQIDAVAILPAVLGLMAWERRPEGRRAIAAGLLIGVGAAVKTVPLLLVFPLLGCTRSWRERVELTVSAVAIPALCLAPLWIAGIDLHRVTGYTGAPGWGGISLVVDPGLGWDHLHRALFVHLGGVSMTLQDASKWITLAASAAVLGFVVRFRPAPIDAAVLLWLAVYVFSPNFFLNYIVWGLPFFIMAGYLIEVAVLQVALIVPTVAYYVSLLPTKAAVLPAAYVPAMIALWVFWVCALSVVIARMLEQRRVQPVGVSPPLVNFRGRPGWGSTGYVT
jgi:hypothetical protein